MQHGRAIFWPTLTWGQHGRAIYWPTLTWGQRAHGEPTLTSVTWDKQSSYQYNQHPLDMTERGRERERERERNECEIDFLIKIDNWFLQISIIIFGFHKNSSFNIFKISDWSIFYPHPVALLEYILWSIAVFCVF